MKHFWVKWKLGMLQSHITHISSKWLCWSIERHHHDSPGIISVFCSSHLPKWAQQKYFVTKHLRVVWIQCWLKPDKVKSSTLLIFPMGVIGTTPFSICFWLSQWILPDSEPGTIHYTKHSDSNSVGGKSVMLTLNRAKFQEMMPKNIVVTYPPLCLLSRKLHHKVHLCGQLLAASLTINWSHKNKEQGTRNKCPLW